MTERKVPKTPTPQKHSLLAPPKYPEEAPEIRLAASKADLTLQRMRRTTKSIWAKATEASYIGASTQSTRDQMIGQYQKMADEYRAQIKEMDRLTQERKKLEFDIASAYKQNDRVKELIKIVKERSESKPD